MCAEILLPDVQQIADALLGTCASFSDVADGVDLEDMPLKFLEQLDELVMCCNTCGWWVEATMVDDDQNCEECAECEEG